MGKLNCRIVSSCFPAISTFVILVLYIHIRLFNIDTCSASAVAIICPSLPAGLSGALLSSVSAPSTPTYRIHL